MSDFRHSNAVTATNIAVAIGIWTQEASFQGQANNGNFRFSGTFVRDPATRDWRLLHAQLSPMMTPPAPPT